MMKAHKVLFLFLIIVSGCLQREPEASDAKHVPVPYPEEAQSIKNPVSVTEGALATGKAKYETYCAICHGKKGRGEEEVTKSFDIAPSSLVSASVKKRSDGELFWALSEGVNGTKMLPWKYILSDDERWHIVNYIRALQKE